MILRSHIDFRIAHDAVVITDFCGLHIYLSGLISVRLCVIIDCLIIAFEFIYIPNPRDKLRYLPQRFVNDVYVFLGSTRTLTDGRRFMSTKRSFFQLQASLLRFLPNLPSPNECSDLIENISAGI